MSTDIESSRLGKLADEIRVEVNAAETQDAATESRKAPGGESAPDPK